MAVYNPYQSQVGYGQYGYNPSAISNMQPSNVRSQGITWVSGEEAARTYPIPYNSTAMLMDSESPVLYVKSVDHMGRITEFEIYDLINRSPKKEASEDFVKKSDLDKMLSEINKRFDEISYRKNQNRKEDK